MEKFKWIDFDPVEAEKKEEKPHEAPTYAQCGPNSSC